MVATVDASDEKNNDEATLAQQEAIENDIKSNSALISGVLPLDTLYEDFLGHTVYLEKLDLLGNKYRAIRRLRRDGNCFYRAFGFAYTEYLLGNQRQKEANNLKLKCDECRDTLLSLGYTQFTVDDFHEQFISMIDRFTCEGGTLAELEETFNDQALSDYYVVFLRLLVSAYMQKNADFYVNFIDSDRTVAEFCEKEVEPMARESDNIHVAVLALAVGLPIAIENCQQSGDLTRIVFPSNHDSSTTTTMPTTDEQNLTEGVASGESSTTVPSISQSPITLLYRPGHYDILYGL